MKKTVLLLSVLVCTILSCSRDEIIFGSGNSISEFRDVSAFTKVSSEGIFEVTLTQGSPQSVEIIADDNVIGNVKTSVIGNQLRLYLDQHDFRNVNLKAHIVVESINGIQNLGSGSISASNISEDGNFKVNNSGSGTISIEGSAESLSLENDGSGKFKGFQFMLSECSVNIIGSGDCEVNASNTLHVTIDGSGDTYYKGFPAISTSITGSGKIINAN